MTKLEIKRWGTAALGLFLASLVGCQNNSKTIHYPNGEKSEISYVKNDSFNLIRKDYYSTGIIKSLFHLKDSLFNGLNEEYYRSGKLESKGYWHLGKKKGWFYFYDSIGNLDKAIEYLPFRDSSVSKPNQIIHFTINGDTIKNGQSIYYEYYSTKDTIKLNKETFTFKIVLAGHKYENAYIGFCDFDDQFNLPDHKPCPVTEMDNYSILLNPRAYHLGENKITGYIVNMEKPLGENGGKFIEIFFSRKFYVVP
ncbi:hypothetical protein ACFJIV_28850 [Mucilaginibacter sp. UC70_90]